MVEYTIPAAATIVVAVIEAIAARDRKQAKAAREKAMELEQAREAIMVQLVQSTNAAIALGEATARAVQRIPDAHCNGDMHAALEYSSKVKHEMRDTLTKQGIHAVWE